MYSPSPVRECEGGCDAGYFTPEERICFVCENGKLTNEFNNTLGECPVCPFPNRCEDGICVGNSANLLASCSECKCGYFAVGRYCFECQIGWGQVAAAVVLPTTLVTGLWHVSAASAVSDAGDLGKDGAELARHSLSNVAIFGSIAFGHINLSLLSFELGLEWPKFLVEFAGKLSSLFSFDFGPMIAAPECNVPCDTSPVMIQLGKFASTHVGFGVLVMALYTVGSRLHRRAQKAEQRKVKITAAATKTALHKKEAWLDSRTLITKGDDSMSPQDFVGRTIKYPHKGVGKVLQFVDGDAPHHVVLADGSIASSTYKVDLSGKRHHFQVVDQKFVDIFVAKQLAKKVHEKTDRKKKTKKQKKKGGKADKKKKKKKAKGKGKGKSEPEPEPESESSPDLELAERVQGGTHTDAGPEVVAAEQSEEVSEPFESELEPELESEVGSEIHTANCKVYVDVLGMRNVDSLWQGQKRSIYITLNCMDVESGAGAGDEHHTDTHHGMEHENHFVWSVTHHVLGNVPATDTLVVKVYQESEESKKAAGMPSIRNIIATDDESVQHNEDILLAECHVLVADIAKSKNKKGSLWRLAMLPSTDGAIGPAELAMDFDVMRNTKQRNQQRNQAVHAARNQRPAWLDPPSMVGVGAISMFDFVGHIIKYPGSKACEVIQFNASKNKHEVHVLGTKKKKTKWVKVKQIENAIRKGRLKVLNKHFEHAFVDEYLREEDDKFVDAFVAQYENQFPQGAVQVIVPKTQAESDLLQEPEYDSEPDASQGLEEADDNAANSHRENDQNSKQELHDQRKHQKQKLNKNKDDKADKKKAKQELHDQHKHQKQELKNKQQARKRQRALKNLRKFTVDGECQLFLRLHKSDVSRHSMNASTALYTMTVGALVKSCATQLDYTWDSNASMFVNTANPDLQAGSEVVLASIGILGAVVAYLVFTEKHTPVWPWQVIFFTGYFTVFLPFLVDLDGDRLLTLGLICGGAIGLVFYAAILPYSYFKQLRARGPVGRERSDTIESHVSQ
jgi:hypothetical protein